MEVGLIGCGNASRLYLEGAKQFPFVRFIACADSISERARITAETFNIPKSCDVAHLLADPRIGVVLNLTDPQSHAEIGIAALEAGKHIYQEKPLAVELDDARRISEIATEQGLRIGCAPDSFLGAGLQTCREIIDQGLIGEPVACTAFMMCHGHEDWHPRPEFFYRRGGGPMFDMGPYYLTALVNFLGPIAGVAAFAKMHSKERSITRHGLHGNMIKVEVPTHVAGTMDFHCGVIGTIIMSFDVWDSNLPFIEIYGTDGTLSVPDPNTYGGPIRLFRSGGSSWIDIPITRLFASQSRGLGLADMIYGISHGLNHRATGDLAYHVLEVLHCFHQSALSGKRIALASSCARPDPLPRTFAFDEC